MVTRLASLLIVLCFSGVVLYFITYTPCSTPMVYTVGSVDKRFDLSKERVVAELTRAEKTWERYDTRNLFEYMPDSAKPDIRVDFVYDSRQRGLETQKAVQAESDAYAKAVRVYEGRLKTYEANSNEYNTAVKKYDADIARWNKGSRRDGAEYSRLHAEAARIDALYTSLDQESKVLEDIRGKLEPIRIALNTKIKEINNKSGQIIEDGRWDSREKTITIYRYEGDKELQWVLAHEFGHAIGMDHVEDPKAVMYYLSSDISEVDLSDGDKAELARVCPL